MKCIACGDTKKIVDPITKWYRVCEFCHPGAANNKTKPIDHRAAGDRAKTFKGMQRKIEQLEKDKAELLQVLNDVREDVFSNYNYAAAMQANYTDAALERLCKVDQLIERMKNGNNDIQC